MTQATLSAKAISPSFAANSFSQRSFSQRHGWAVPTLLGLGMLLAMLGSLCIGVFPISFRQAARIVLHLLWPSALPANPPWTVKEITVVQIVRLPRVLLATLSGLGLGMSGAALQGMMRNPLVGPDVVGVSSGAAVGGILAMLWDFSPAGIIAMAFCGGMIAMAMTFGLAKLAHAGTDSMVMILAGIFIGALFVAMISLIVSKADDAHLPRMVYCMLGTFVGADPKHVAMIGIPTLAGGAMLMSMRWRLNLLSLGDLDAQTLGLNVSVLRWLIIALVSLIVASQVAVSGLVGWVGLVVPHCARMLVGPDHRRLLPAAALLGALFVLGLDDFTRAVIGAEIPVGVLTALFGTPVVCYLLWKSHGQGWGRE
jgi:iron complex transport system permease protein